MAPPVRTVAVRVELPWEDTRPDAPDPSALSGELRLLWIVEQVRQHRFGVGKGAELAGLPRAAFMRMLGEHGVPVIAYAAEELDGESRAVDLG